MFSAHPDDAELSCGGTLIKHAELGYKTGIIDLTEGEMGTRGTVEIRYEEAAASAKILGLSIRENLKFRDGWFTDDEAHRLKIIQKIRLYQPEIVITNSLDDRHPDHGRAAHMVKEAAWLAGLQKIETAHEGILQTKWRPKHVYHAIQFTPAEPDFIVDIAGFEDRKMAAILAYSTQFYNPEAEASNTLISQPGFLELLRSRMMSDGNYAEIEKGEAFMSAIKPAINNLFDLI